MTMHNKKPDWDICLSLLKILIVSAYISLIFIKPTGENWGRGWNLVAYWIYVAPTILVVGGLHIWRQKAITHKSRGLDILFLAFAFMFPVISLIAMKLKS